MYVHSPGNGPLSRLSRSRAPVGPVVMAVVGLALVALAAAACGGAPASVKLPPKARAASTAQVAVTAPPATPRQRVTAAYNGYWQAYATAMSAGSAARARAVLSPYTTPAGISPLISSLKHVWAAHDVAYGAAVTHVLSVQITGHRAVLHDCLDLSHLGAMDTATGDVVPDSLGLPDQDFYVILLLSGGRWRVSNMQSVEVPCKP
jgi:hypothetical protein